LTDGCNMTWNFFWHRAWERAPWWCWGNVEEVF
jgi:hypothetical protein